VSPAVPKTLPCPPVAIPVRTPGNAVICARNDSVVNARSAGIAGAGVSQAGAVHDLSADLRMHIASVARDRVRRGGADEVLAHR